MTYTPTRDHLSDARALLTRTDPETALAVADAATADYWRARDGEITLTLDMQARHAAYAPVAVALRSAIRDRDMQAAEQRAADRIAAGLPPIADVEALPLATRCDESTDAPNANSSVPDSYDEIRSVMRPDGTVGKRGRAVISADPRSFATPSFPRLDGTTGYTDEDLALVGPVIDYCERRSYMVAKELESIVTDRDGRYSAIGLDRIAERVYGCPRLIGSEHVSWEELLTVTGDEDTSALGMAAELASAVAHLNPSDPIAAAERWLGGHANRDHGARFAKVHRPTVLRHAVRTSPGATGKRGPVRETFALPRGRTRSGDVVERSTIATRTTHLFAPADPIAVRTAIAPTATYAPRVVRWTNDDGTHTYLVRNSLVHRTTGHVAVRTGQPDARFIGHARYTRPTTQRNAPRKRARVARRAAETIDAPTRDHLNAIIGAIARGTSAIVRYRDHDIRVSRHAEHGRYSLRVQLATGATVTRSNRRTAATTAATIANAIK